MKKILNILCTAIAAVLLCGGIAGCAPQTYGTFYTLEEAYEAGILTHDELMSIAYYPIPWHIRRLRCNYDDG